MVLGSIGPLPYPPPAMHRVSFQPTVTRSFMGGSVQDANWICMRKMFVMLLSVKQPRKNTGTTNNNEAAIPKITPNCDEYNTLTIFLLHYAILHLTTSFQACIRPKRSSNCRVQASNHKHKFYMDD
jgi:hypothetical protein